MLELFENVVTRLGRGERLALCVVVTSRGSTPQERGAKMLVTAAGQSFGTLGGGCVEAEVRRVAVELIAAGTSQLMDFRLDHDYGWDDGLICGGTMDILVQVLTTPAEAEPFRMIADTIATQRIAELRLPYRDERGEQEYVEEIGPPPVLVIAGAGHVGQALGALAATLGFQVDVIDDRADYVSISRFPAARRLIVGDIETHLASYPAHADTYVVIVTRGHRHDGRALAAVIDSPAKYVGLIGSKSKIKRIFDDLLASGVPIDKLLRVHAPIGLELGAVTVPEIATSIAAELIATRRGRAGISAGPMKMDAHELRRWLARKDK